MTQRRVLITLALVLIAALATTAAAQIAVSGNDNKVLLMNGVVTVVANPPSDSVSIIDLSGPAAIRTAEK